MNFEFIVPGEQVPIFQYVYRVPIQRPVMPAEYPYDPAEYLPARSEALARAVVSFRSGTITVSLLPTPYTPAKAPLVIWRGLMPVPPSRREAVEILKLGLLNVSDVKGK